jgi:Na+-translocating ferredoxin:NAD+ oxidoreductase RnfD subunit
LGTYGALLFGRSWWLGDPMAIAIHQLSSGAFLIFAFFMISDPKTTPNTSVGRIVYGALVASVAYIIQFVFYEPNGPIIALILSAPLVPLLDLSMRGHIYRWEKPMTKNIGNIKGV